MRWQIQHSGRGIPHLSHCVTRWDLSWLEMSQLAMKSSLGGGWFFCPLSHHLRGIELLFYEKWVFFWKHVKLACCSVKVMFLFLCQFPPFLSHSCVSRSFFFDSQTVTPPSCPFPWLLPLFLSLCPSGKLCLPCHSPCRPILCGFCTDSDFEGGLST